MPLKEIKADVVQFLRRLSSYIYTSINFFIFLFKILLEALFIIIRHMNDTCSLGLIEKLPAVGFIQVMYWQLWISFSTSRCLSYLKAFISV